MYQDGALMLQVFLWSQWMCLHSRCGYTPTEIHVSYLLHRNVIFYHELVMLMLIRIAKPIYTCGLVYLGLEEIT